MAPWDYVEWLLYWILETSQFEFQWDKGNSEKNLKKHGIEIKSIENVFRSGLALPLGIQITPIVNEQRLGIIGPDLSEKILQIVFVLREGKVRVISARIAHKKERLQYEEILRKINERL